MHPPLNSLLTGILVFFLASCPLWCATFEASLGACHQHAGRHHATDQDQPAPTPVNNDDCVCNGAVCPTDGSSTIPSLSAWGLGGLAFCWLAPACAGLAAPEIPVRPRGMSSNDPARRHCAPDRAILQSFRC
jgi:hypothetical protein